MDNVHQQWLAGIYSAPTLVLLGAGIAWETFGKIGTL